MKSSILYKVLFGHYTQPKIIQITKINKAEYYYRDKMGRKQKNVKKSKARRGKSKKGQAISQCEISQGLRKFATLHNCYVFCLPFGLPSGSAALSSN